MDVMPQLWRGVTEAIIAWRGVRAEAFLRGNKQAWSIPRKRSVWGALYGDGLDCLK
jgi:hypothetical protein